MTPALEDPELRALFLEELTKHVTTCLRAKPEDTMPSVRALHALRGAAGMLGLQEISARVAEAEQWAREGDLASVQAWLPLLLDAIELLGLPVSQLRTEVDLATLTPRRSWDALPLRAATRSSDRPSLEPEVYEFFVTEALARLDKLGESLQQSSLGARDALEESFRHAHALKGSALTVGIGTLARAAHALESALSALRARGHGPNAQEMDVFATVRGHLVSALRDPARAATETEKAERLLLSSNLLHPQEQLTVFPASERSRRVQPQELIRVPTSAVAALVEVLGEAGFVGDRVGRQAIAVQQFARVLSEVARVSSVALERIGPPKPWGAPADALTALGWVTAELFAGAAELEQRSARLETDARVLGSVVTTARESIERLEATTASWLFDRMIPTAEAAARTQGKSVHVVSEGGAIELSRTLAERLAEPLAQLVRNAVTHGIEAPELRLAKGKPARGVLLLGAYHYGGRLHFVVEDDGAGIDIDEVASRAIRLGLLTEEASKEREAVLSMLFRPGFSMRDVADASAGRGVGLDLVRRELTQLGGTIQVHTERAQRTRFEIEVPPRSLALRVLVVRAAGDRIALPLHRVRKVVRTPDAEREIPVRSLGEVLGERTEERGPIVLLSGPKGEGTFGLRVEEVERAREFVMRPLPSLLRGIRPWSASVVDGAGRVLLVADVDQLRASR